MDDPAGTAPGKIGILVFHKFIGCLGSSQRNRVGVTRRLSGNVGIAANQPRAVAQSQSLPFPPKIKIGLIGPPRTCAGDEHLIAITPTVAVPETSAAPSLTIN